jgi:hypothetical protein
MLSALSDVALRTAPFRSRDQWLFWPRARLYSDRLELTGWSLSGRYRRVIPLGRIEEAEAADGHLVLHRTAGSPLRLGMDAPEQWASAIATYRDLRSRGT